MCQAYALHVTEYAGLLIGLLLVYKVGISLHRFLSLHISLSHDDAFSLFDDLLLANVFVLMFVLHGPYVRLKGKVTLYCVPAHYYLIIIVCMVCVGVLYYTRMRTCMRMHMHGHMGEPAHTGTCAHMHTHRHMHAHAYTHRHMRMRAHTLDRAQLHFRQGRIGSWHL